MAGIMERARRHSEAQVLLLNPAVSPSFSVQTGYAISIEPSGAVSGGPLPCNGELEGSYLIRISPGEIGTTATVGAPLGVGLPEVFSLTFDISTGAQAAGNVFTAEFPDATDSCDSTFNPNCQVVGPSTNDATAQSLDPTIDDIEIVDANGQVVPYFTFTTVDGLLLPSALPTSPSQVPEPSAAMLMGTGLLGLIGAAFFGKMSATRGSPDIGFRHC